MPHKDPKVRREYIKKQSKNWRKNNPEKDRERNKRSNERARRRGRQFQRMLLAYKAHCGCCKCRYAKDPRALEFHHRDPKSKKFTIASILHWKSWEQIMDEVDKCDVTCSNCHQIDHAEKRGVKWP